MFQFPGLPPRTLWVRVRVRGHDPARVPPFGHPRIDGSLPSPRIIAACRALRRLPVPRHPPCALNIFFSYLGALPRPRDLLRRAPEGARVMMLHVSRAMQMSRCRGLTGPPVQGCPGNRMLREGDGAGRALLFQVAGASLDRVRTRKCLPRKEVIQPHLPVRLPCYDFTPLTLHTFDASAPERVRPAASGADDSGGVTGGVYKARERIHRGMLIRDY